MRRLSGTVSLVLLGLISGCNQIQDDVDVAEVSAPVDCGSATCDRGQVCCNESCGICAPPGADCSERACGTDEPDPCASVECSVGTHCEVTEIQCVTSPCDPLVACVQDDVVGCELVDCQPDFTCVEDGNGQGHCEPVEAAPVACGENTCAVGETCCNASCGTCTPPGGVCAQASCNVTAPSCDLVCAEGQHCALNEVQCATPPCAVEPSCVSDDACTGPIIDCAAPPEDCNYVGGGCVKGQWTCGELVCAPEEPCDLTCDAGKHCELVEVQCFLAPCPLIPKCISDGACKGPIIDCAAPPEDCNYVGGGCVNGEWTCGELVCAPTLDCDPACEEGTHCEEVEVQCFIAPCLPLLKCVAN